MAYVRLRGKVWYLAYRDEHGALVVKAYKQARNRTEALRYARELERTAERVRLGFEHARPQDVTLSEAARRYVASRPPEYASKKALEGRLKRAERHLGSRKVRRITKADLEEMLAANGDVSPQTREHIRVAVQGLYTFLIGAKLATENPAKELGKLAVPESKPKYLTKSEIVRLFTEIPEHWRAAAQVALATGVRKSELLGLPKGNVRLSEQTILIDRTLTAKTTKGKRERVLPIPAYLLPTLERQLRTPGPLLFATPEGKAWSKSVRLHDIIRRALNRAGIVEFYDVACKGRGKRKGCGFTERRTEKGAAACPRCGMVLRLYPHAKPLRWKELRSSFGTHAAAETGDIRFVQAILGHSDINVTVKRYAHALPSHLQAQADRVALFVGGLSADFGQTSPNQTAAHQHSSNHDEGGQEDANPDNH